MTPSPGEFHGTADTIQLAEAQTTTPTEVFSEANVRRSWISLKQQFPLLGSSSHTDDEGKTGYFLVDEARLGSATSAEIRRREVDSIEAVEAIVQEFINGPRQLSSGIPARLYVLTRTDQADRFHILLHATHHITDGLANATALRTLLDYLTSPPVDLVPELEARLALVVAPESLNPSLKLSIAHQRWRQVIAFVISEIKWRKIKVRKRSSHPHNSSLNLT